MLCGDGSENDNAFACGDVLVSGFKCECSNCSWTGRRNAKNTGKKPYLKCGGQVTVHEKDKGALIWLVVIVVGFCVVTALLTGNW